MCLCMYVCMYVCMHACMYVCMYICMYVYMYICMYLGFMTRKLHVLIWYFKLLSHKFFSSFYISVILSSGHLYLVVLTVSPLLRGYLPCASPLSPPTSQNRRGGTQNPQCPTGPILTGNPPERPLLPLVAPIRIAPYSPRKRRNCRKSGKKVLLIKVDCLYVVYLFQCWGYFCPKHKDTKICEKKNILTLSCWYSLECSRWALRWVPICQGFSHFSPLHHFLFSKLATSSIKVKNILNLWM